MSIWIMRISWLVIAVCILNLANIRWFGFTANKDSLDISISKVLEYRREVSIIGTKWASGMIARLDQDNFMKSRISLNIKGLWISKDGTYLVMSSGKTWSIVSGKRMLFIFGDDIRIYKVKPFKERIINKKIDMDQLQIGELTV